MDYSLIFKTPPLLGKLYMEVGLLISLSSSLLQHNDNETDTHIIVYEEMIFYNSYKFKIFIKRS